MYTYSYMGQYTYSVRVDVMNIMYCIYIQIYSPVSLHMQFWPFIYVIRMEAHCFSTILGCENLNFQATVSMVIPGTPNNGTPLW